MFMSYFVEKFVSKIVEKCKTRVYNIYAEVNKVKKMNFRNLFIKMAGEEIYEAFITGIANKIIDVYKIEMSLDMFDKTIQANVKAVILIGISRASEVELKDIRKRLERKDIKKYFYEEIETFIEDNKEYIDIIEKYIRNRIK